MTQTSEERPLSLAAPLKQRWMHAFAPDAKLLARPAVALVGIFPGEGSGPEIIRATLRVLDALESVTHVRVIRRFGGEIGLRAPGAAEGRITEPAAAFCRQVFDEEGAILTGPAGGRFVYDLRRRFNLWCKLAPLKPDPGLTRVNRLKAGGLAEVDILMVRDNAAGVYQGDWSQHDDPEHGRIAEQRFCYTQAQVERIIEVGARLALTRRKRLHVVLKDGGVPTISDLWRQCGGRMAAAAGVELTCVNADHAAYRLIQHPREFDVIVTPNMVGDILADLGAVLLGSRGLSWSSNVGSPGCAVYQTGHGAAYDLQGTDRANPVAQILSLAAMLHESFGFAQESLLIERAVGAVWRAGWRTDDLAEPGCRSVGTQRLADLVAEAVVALAGAEAGA